MAKKGSNTITGAVRAYLIEHPDEAASKVVSDLASQGVVIDPQNVYTVRAQMKKRGEFNGAPKKRAMKKKAGRKTTANKRRGRPPGSTASPSADYSDSDLSAAALFEARAFITQLGGFQEARKAIDTLEKLQA